MSRIRVVPRRDGRVAAVEVDRVVRTAATTQTNATWGLDRIDQRDLPLSSTYTYTATGAGVRAYVLDTGIELSHEQFTGRLAPGFDVITAGGDADDCNGHGTHVTGTVGGTTHGVAKGVTLVPVRVLGCDGSGTVSGVIAGVDWVTEHHVEPAVANMSLSGGASTSLDAAVQRSVTAGVTYVVAAGNKDADACNYSPARSGDALTVGSTTSTDVRSSFSNFGRRVDLFAPGSSITSTWHTSSTATHTISGTSMASPHVAGVAALYLQGAPSASPSEVAEQIIDGATTGKVTSAGSGSPDLLLHVTGGAAAVPSGSAPSVTISGSSCSGARCDFTGVIEDDDPEGVTYRWDYGDGSTSPLGTGSVTVSCVTSGKGKNRTVSCAVGDTSPTTDDGGNGNGNGNGNGKKG